MSYYHSTNASLILAPLTSRHSTARLLASLHSTALASGAQHNGAHAQRQTSATNRTEISTDKKYLVYLCDAKKYCFGLGDRQRGIASVYLLAELTNRTFGLIMTAPSNLTEFYQPSGINWDIPEAELQGKSTIDLDVLGYKVDLKLDKIDFNVNYTQDVVYIRTNQKFHYTLVKNPLYKDKFPEWAKVPSKLYQNAWIRLMAPSDSLRQSVNEFLMQIYSTMEIEQRIWKVMNSSGCCFVHEPVASTCSDQCFKDIVLSCCSKAVGLSRLTQSGCSSPKCSTYYTKPSCLNTTKFSANATDCSDMQPNCSSVDCLHYNSQIRCMDKLFLPVNNSTDLPLIREISSKLCTSPPLTTKLNVTRESIQRSKQYDTVNLNLVCAHIRLGHSKTMPFENNVRNKVGDEKAVWKFLKPYVDKGYHVFLASDSEEVRQAGKNLFGYRLHTSDVPIVHIAAVQQGQDKVVGFRLTLMEQLLLATSCSVLVISYSGFSMKAAQFRDILQPGKGHLFIFRNANVWPVTVSQLL